MKTAFKNSVLAGVAILAFTAASASAATIANATFTFSNLGDITYDPAGGALTGATSVTISSTEIINGIPTSYLGNPNDFYTGGSTPLSLGDSIAFDDYTLDLTFSSLPVVTFPGSDRFTFTATAGQKSTSNAAGGTSFLNVYYSGTFHDTLGTYTDAPASIAMTFTQTGGPTGGVGMVASFATPPEPPNTVPEPTTTVLIGTAFVGLGFLRRKKRA
jgi:hypothetical protein